MRQIILLVGMQDHPAAEAGMGGSDDGNAHSSSIDMSTCLGTGFFQLSAQKEVVILLGTTHSIFARASPPYSITNSKVKIRGILHHTSLLIASYSPTVYHCCNARVSLQPILLRGSIEPLGHEGKINR
jgi:hypothetical protein